MSFSCCGCLAYIEFSCRKGFFFQKIFPSRCLESADEQASSSFSRIFNEDLKQKNWRSLNEEDVLQDLLGWLTELNYLRETETPHHPKGGRPFSENSWSILKSKGNLSYQSLFFSNLLKKHLKNSKPSFEGFEGAKNRVLEESKNDERILSEIIHQTVERGSCLYKCKSPQQADPVAYLTKKLPIDRAVCVIRNCELNTYSIVIEE